MKAHSNDKKIANGKKIANLSIKAFARLTGFMYFLLIPFGVLGIMYIPGLVVEGDLAATIANLRENESMFKLSMLAALLTQFVHIAVALMLYRLFISVDRTVARLLVLVSLVGVPIAMLNELNNGAILLVLNNPDISDSLINLFLGIHKYGIMIVGFFWGLWLFPMGYLAYKSNFMPKIIGIALMIGCFGYVADSFIFILNPDFGFLFAQFLFIGEVMITFWLLIMGVNEEKWRETLA